MKYLRLIYANILRKKMRFFLTIGSFGVALFLFGILVAIHNGFYEGINAVEDNRLIVRNKTSLLVFLPYSYKAKIEAMEGVEYVIPSVWFAGVYKDRKNFFSQFAIETAGWAETYPEYAIDKDQWSTFAMDRQGCMVGKALADKFGWKVGDRIPIEGTIFPGAWEFNISGIFEGNKKNVDLNQMWIRYEYLAESIPFMKGQVGWYAVKANHTDYVNSLISRIDGEFSNSPAETKTEPEKIWMIGFAKQMGNINLILISVGGVVIFTLLLVTGSTMAMSVRERTSEWATLKTLGYGDGLVLGLVLGESFFYAFIGGAVGLGLAWLFVSNGDPTGMMGGLFALSAGNILAGLGLTLITGFFAGVVPAVSAMKLRIVDALRRV
ncbi:MAG: Lipoprotein-releasing system transmembrane protein LolE [Verrucomicrobia bacterium ADurb.Bin474]|nr:MAG: Lipoprotein-releasing system transmembrane protein LolE [Verrucomicrobia bacterium ADurb.Bin474]